MRFECQESCGGNCCKIAGSGTYVFLTKEDAVRISDYTKEPLYAFAAIGEFSSTRFTRKKTAQWFLRTESNECRFLKEGKCSIWEARPTQCRTFPYWPENIKPKGWDAVAKICPGVNVGDKNESFPNLKKQLEADEELCKNCIP
jgi:Fe-S-cluster containining protein